MLAGQRTCDTQVAGLSPVTKQYNLVPAIGVVSFAGKVTTSLAESNDSLPPCMVLRSYFVLDFSSYIK